MNSSYFFKLTTRVVGGLLLTLASGIAIAQICTPPTSGTATFFGNSYFAGIGQAGAGQNTISFTNTTGGARATPGGTPPSGAWAVTQTAIVAGDLVFVIQMQDATLVTANDDTYGNGIAGGFGQGTDNLRNAGRWEFGLVTAATATGVTLKDNLQYEYNTAPASATNSRRSFQVIRVQQNKNLVLSSASNLSVIPWDGSTGGVIVFDDKATLNFGGVTVNADAAGFRGGGSFQGNTQNGSTDFITLSSNTTGGGNGLGGMKGEGIAGTPRLVRGTTITNGYTGTSAGLPSGDQGYPGTGDRSRGAPGNAGGGGTSHNSGGGGGSNSGSGGKGGYSFAFYITDITSTTCGGTPANPAATPPVLPVNGTPSRTFPNATTGDVGDQDPAAPNPNPYYACGGDAARDVGGNPGGTVSPSADRLILGGGAGAGDNNNAIDDNKTTAQASGGNGGGLILVRASAVSGTGTLTANGQDGEVAGRDGAGGGGAGGTVALAIPNPSSVATLGLTISAQGGKGGNTGRPLYKGNGEAQGPGGAGGGGSVLAPANVSFSTSPNISGGAAGFNIPVDGVSNPYGTAAGAGQVTTIDYQPPNLPNSNACYAPTVLKSVSTATATRVQGQDTTATYTVVIEQPANRLAISGVNLVDDLPAPFNVAAGTVATVTYSNISGSGAALSSGPATLTASGTGAGPYDPVTFGVAGGNATNSFSIQPGGRVTVTFTVNLNNAPVGTYQNPVSVNSTNTASGLPVVATYDPASSTAEDVVVIPPPGLSKAFDPVYTTPGSLSRLTLTLTNPTSTPATLTAALVDTLPSGVTVATPAGTANVTTTCTGTGTVTAAASTLTVPAGRIIPASGSCTVSVTVTSSTVGTATNSIPAGALVTDRGTGPAASAPLVVLAPTKTVALQVDADGTLTPTIGDTLRYTLVYTLPVGAPTITGFQITDILPAGVTKIAGAGNGVTVTASGAGTSATEQNAYDGTAANPNLLSAANLAAGGTITVTIDAVIQATAPAPTTLSNTARASGPGLPPLTGGGTGGGLPTDAEGPAVGTPCSAVPCPIPQPQDTPPGAQTPNLEPTQVTVAPTPRAITGKVYRDLGKDGTQNGTDPGLAGVTVTLRDGANNVITTATTLADGSYSFPNLAPGTYSVTETQPAGFGSSENPSNTASVTVPVAGTTAIAGPNFGEIAGSVSGTVYRDDNNDGAKAGTEPGLSGVQVQLLDSSNNPVDTDPVASGVQSTVTTDPNGNYSFPNVLGGTGYRVVETQPAGFADGKETAGTAGGTVPTTTGNTAADNTITGINVPTPVSTLSSDPSNATGYLFGERGQTLSGKVYLDQDRSNAQNGTEPGLLGVTVTLRDGANNVVATTTTLADGTYSFPNLSPGTYTVTETQPAGYGSSETPTNTASVTVPATANATATVVGPNFGDTLGSLSGRVFRDPNNDGIQLGATETGVQGVPIDILDGSGNPVDTDPVASGVQSTVLTDVNGNYTFPNLPAGSYRIRETQPPCCTDGKEVAGTAGGTIPTTTGSDPASNTITAITLPVAAQATGYNFAELPLAGISGTVFNDRDRDGTQAGTEPGIPGVTVTLRDSANNVVATTTTGPGGAYTFPNVPTGTYTVTETQPAGYGSSAATPNTQSVTIPAGGSGTVNFGDTLSTLSGTVYRDNDDSGTKQPTEAGIAGVTVTVKDASGNDIDSDPTTVAIEPTTALTDANGNYTFRDLPQGTYQIVENQPAAYVDGKETAGAAGGTVPTTTGNDPASNTISSITLGAGVDATGYLFGERGTPINGTVFRDDNRDGIKDPGEPGIPTVTVELRDSAGNPIDSDPSTPAIEPTTTTTDANGNYSFPNVPAGNYQVVETQPAAFGSSTPNTVPVTVVTGTPSTVNFGETQGRISGSVYNDANDNGTKDAGEAGLAGVTVTLKDAAGADIDSDPVATGVQPTTAITDSSGNYSFNKLPVGTYRVVETQPAGIQDGKDTAGTAGGTTVVNDEIRSIVLTPGLDATGYLFGEKAPTGTVIGRVFRDDNGNGSQGATEPGLAGVQVRITNGAFSTVVTTDANGNYSAPGVPVGTATVDIVDSTLPANVTQTAGVDPSAVTVLLNQTTDAGADGYRLQPPVATNNSATTLIDTPVTFPITGDDSSAPGTTIDPGSVDLDPTTPGDQKERVVPEGKYTVDPTGKVTFTPNPGVTGTVTPIQYTVRDSTGTTSNPATISVTVGPATRGDVTGVVFRDDNGNGTQDVGEPGISNVSVLVTNGSFTQTAVTDSSGKYVAVGVPVGTATVDVVESTLPAGLTQTAGTDPSTVPVVAGTTANAGIDGYRPKPPVATGDTATTPANTPVTIPVLGNDSATGPNALVPSSVEFPTTGQPTNAVVSPDKKTVTFPGEGKYEIQPDGTVKFTPDPGFTGTTTPVVYTVKDDKGQTSNPAPITVNVGAPTKGDVTGVVFKDTNGNGTQDPGEPGLPGVQVTVTNGSFTQTVTTDSSGKYTAVGVPVGTATVDVVDSTLPAGVTQTAGTDPSSVNVIAGQTADAGKDGYRTPPPVATNDSATTPLNTPVTLPGAKNDTPGTPTGAPIDPGSVDLDPATPGDQKTRTVPEGVYTANPDGSVTFTPNPGVTGTVTPIQYTVRDTAGSTSNPASLSVTIGAPTKGDVTGVVFKDTDGNGTQDAGEPGLPGVSVTVTNGSFTQTVVTDSSGNYTAVGVPIGTATVDVVDSTLPVGVTQTAGTDPSTVTVVAGQTADAGKDGYTVKAQPPVAVNDSASTPANTPVTIPVLGNDSGTSAPLDPKTVVFPTAGQPTNAVVSPDGKKLTVPGEGVYTIDPNTGAVTFTPEPTFTGPAKPVQYTVKDTAGNPSNPATINVTVGPVGTINGVVFRDDNGNGVQDSSEPGLPGVQVKVTNLGGFDQTVTTDGQGRYSVPNVPLGDATVDIVDSTIPAGFKPTVPANDPTKITVVAGNNDAGKDGYRPAPPVATDDRRTTPIDTPVTFTITGNDTASNPYNIVPSTVDLDPATPGDQKTRTVPEGVYTANPTGEVTFTPNPGFSGKVTEITYTVLDSSGQKSNEGKINVTVLPVSSDDSATTPQGVPTTIDVLANDKGNLDPATVKVKSPPANGSVLVNPDGTIKYTPRTGFSGTDIFTYEVCDKSGSCTTSTVTVTVTPRPAGSLSGQVFDDLNGNGKLEPSDPGIPGAKVELFEQKPDGTPDFTKPILGTDGKPLTAITDKDGNYSFPSVPPGPVAVRVTDPAGKVLTTNNNPQNVTVQPSIQNTATPVGYVAPKINLTLTPGVTVVTPGDNLPYTAVVTNNTPGAITPLKDPVLTVTLPKGVVFDPTKPVTVNGTTIPAGNVSVKLDPTDPTRQILVIKLPNELKNNEPQTIKFNTIVTPAVDPTKPLIAVGEATGKATNGTTTVSVSSGAVAAAAVKINLGVFSNETIILGRVYFDNNDNNNFDAGDKPLAGARVYLSDGRYAVTDANGLYNIPNVAPGTYAVRLDPVTAPYDVKRVPDDQGAPGTRYVRAAEAGGITHEDFLLSAPKGAAVKSRSTLVQRGPVSLKKVITQGGAGYAVTYTITVTSAVRNLSITDPLPAGATRGPITGATLDGNVLRFPGVTQPGTYTVTFALFTSAPPDLVLTDPDIFYEQIFTLIPMGPGDAPNSSGPAQPITPSSNQTAPSDNSGGDTEFSTEVIR